MHSIKSQMIKNILAQQKTEIQERLLLPFLPREKLHDAKKWLNSDLITVILGPRRAGKSVFALQLLKDRPFAYCNFDDENILEYLSTDLLMKAIDEVYPGIKTIFFDEIQNLPKWELFANRLQRQGYKLILTGSNAKLLNQELTTHLTGRHIPIEILPFSSREFLRAKNCNLEGKEKLSFTLKEHLIHGGYPEVVLKDLEVKGYLEVLFHAVLFQDIVKRHKIRFSEQIDRLGAYLMNTVAAPYTIRKLVNILGLRSGVTAEKYLEYLQEAYVLFSLHRFSHKVGERLMSPKKIYVVDNGFIHAKAIQHSPDTGKLFENMIFLELLKKGLAPNREFFYYTTKNHREVDFMIKKGTKIRELLQVAYEIENPDTEQREVKALLEAHEELHANQLTIVTWETKKEIRQKKTAIRVVPIWEWILKE